jgi:NAD(P)-dependent dehydrogenase (short-subunit alcohol dehydrogenase family)
MKLSGKVALVTGSARGLGRAYALHLAKLGADVVINDVNLDAAREYNEKLTAPTVMDEIKALGVRSIGIQADVTVRSQVEDMFRRLLDEFGRIDILVANAGGNLRSPGQDHTASGGSEEGYSYIMDINLTGTIFCCQAASGPMKRQRSGKIINVSSQAGLWESGEGNNMPYKVAKAGVVQYTRVLAAELGPYNINVNCIAPGFILSSRAIAQGRADEKNRKALEARIPLRRLGVPEDCAKVVEFLATDLSDYVTGQCITICGGFVLF